MTTIKAVSTSLTMTPSTQTWSHRKPIVMSPVKHNQEE